MVRKRSGGSQTSLGKFGFAKVRLRQCAGSIVYIPLPLCLHFGSSRLKSFTLPKAPEDTEKTGSQQNIQVWVKVKMWEKNSQGLPILKLGQRVFIFSKKVTFKPFFEHFPIFDAKTCSILGSTNSTNCAFTKARFVESKVEQGKVSTLGAFLWIAEDVVVDQNQTAIFHRKAQGTSQTGNVLARACEYLHSP